MRLTQRKAVFRATQPPQTAHRTALAAKSLQKCTNLRILADSATNRNKSGENNGSLIFASNGIEQINPPSQYLEERGSHALKRYLTRRPISVTATRTLPTTNPPLSCHRFTRHEINQRRFTCVSTPFGDHIFVLTQCLDFPAGKYRFQHGPGI